MALNLGQIRTSLLLNITQFSQQVNRVNRLLTILGKQLSKNFVGANSAMHGANNAANQLNKSFKDMERIVGGILISQAFYQGTNAIQNATSALVSFMNEMERSQISLEYFLGTPEKASAFLLNMKDFAADTAFDTGQALTLSRRLMSAQFAPEEVRSVMEILNDASVVSGGTAEEMNRIVLALQQVKTQGTLAGQELRQFAEAQIPIYQILREELGLTGDQMKKIGKLKINADVAIAGILSGLEKRYKGAASRIAETMGGMWDNIKDNTKFLSSELFEKPYKAIEGFVRRIRNKMNDLRTVLTEKGIGGVFENLIPPDMHYRVRAVLGSLQSLIVTFGILWKAVQPVIASMARLTVNFMSVVLPVIAAVARNVAIFTHAAIQASPVVRGLAVALAGLLIAGTAARALMLLWTVTRMGVVAAVVARTVTMLARSIGLLLTIMVRSPLVAAVVIVAGIFLYLAATSKYAADAIDYLTNKLGGFAGVNFADIFKPFDNSKLANAMDDYAKKIDLMQGKLKGVGKEASDAGNKVKKLFVASFDELYNIPETLDDIDKDLDLDNLDDFKDILDPGAIDITPPAIPVDMELPNFDDIKKKFEDFWQWLMLLPAKYNKPPGGGDGGHKFQENFKVALDDMTNYTIKMFDVISGKLANFPVVVGRAASSLGDLLKPAIDDAKVTLTAFAEPLVTVANAFKTFETEVDLSVQGVSTSLSTLPTLMGNTINGMEQAIINALIPQWWQNMMNSVNTTISNGVTGFGILWTGFFDSVGVKLSLAYTNFTTGWSGIFTTMGVTISTAFTNFKTSWSNFFTDVGTSISTAYTNFTKSWSGIFETMGTTLADTFKDWKASWTSFFSGVAATFTENFEKWKTGWSSIFTGIGTTFSENLTNWKEGWKTFFGGIGEVASNGWKQISEHWETFKTNLFGPWKTFLDDFKGKTWKDFWNGLAIPGKKVLTEELPQWWEENKSAVLNILLMMIPGIGAIMPKIGNALKLGFGGFMDDIAIKWGTWLDDLVLAITKMVGKATKALGSFIDDMTGGLAGKVSGAVSNITGGKVSLPGYATGSIIDQEQIARVGEGGKREAIIPMESSSYMKPFSAAVASDLVDMLGGMAPSSGNRGSDDRPILYVGTLIGDDRSLKELYRKMEVIGVSENQRKGLSNG